MAEEVDLFQKDEKFLDKIRQTMAGMREEAETIRQMQNNISEELELLEREITEALELVEKAEELLDRNIVTKGEHRDLYHYKKNVKESQRYENFSQDTIDDYDEEVKNAIHEVAQVNRKAEQKIAKINKIIEDAEEKIKSEAKELSRLSDADSKVGEMESRLEEVNQRLPGWNPEEDPSNINL